MAKLDKEFEALFIETPIKKKVEKAKPVKTISLDGVGSLRLVGELVKRHNVDLQVVGFWGLLAAIAWLKLG